MEDDMEDLFSLYLLFTHERFQRHIHGYMRRLTQNIDLIYKFNGFTIKLLLLLQ